MGCAGALHRRADLPPASPARTRSIQAALHPDCLGCRLCLCSGRPATVKGGPGWHPLLPRSFFARTLLLVLLVTLFSKILTLVYLMSNEDLLVDRQYSHGSAMLVQAYWASGPDARADLEELTGLELVPE